MNLDYQSIIEKRENHTLILNCGTKISYKDFNQDVQKFKIVSENFVALKCTDPYQTLVALFALWAEGKKVCLLPSKMTELELRVIQKNIPFEKLIPLEFSLQHVGNRNFNFLSTKNQLVILSSGSSGATKGIVHGLSQIYYSAKGSIQFYNLTQKDTYPLTLPLNHVGGLMIFIRCFLSGSIFEISSKRSEAIYSPKATILSLVPAQLFDLMKKGKASKSLRCILLGGAKAGTKLIRRAYDDGYPLSLTYGSSEACSQVYASKVEDKAFGPTKLLPYRKTQIENGTLLLGGETRMNALYQNGKLIYPFNKHGYYETSDEVIFDPCLKVKRKDSLIISGGENLDLSIWESTLLQHPHILEAQAISVEDERMGEVGYLFYHSLHEHIESELKDYLSQTISCYRLPKKVLPLPPLNQKIKHTLAELRDYARQTL